MRRQKRAVMKQYKSKSLYYKFYFLPLLIVLLAASYSICLCIKVLKVAIYIGFAGQQYIYNPLRAFYQKYRLYLQKFSLLRL